MSRALSNIVQSQIVNTLNRSISDIRNLVAKVDMLSSNNATLFSRLSRHETGIDVHNLRELILDALNENMLVNPALESYELDDNVPDGFSLYDGLEGYSDNGPDYSIYKHGEKSFRMSATYDGFGTPKEIYLSQTVERVFYDGEHTVSFYHTDNGADNFEYVCRIVAYDEYGQWLGTIDVPVPQTVAELEFDEEEEEYLRDNAKSTMRRHSAQVELPAGIRKAELHVGIRLYPGAQDVTAWFDYFMLSQGNLLYRPPELVEGVLQTKHISTNGLDAKVIKTGQITITENLELATKDGRIRMHFDEVVGGNVIDFLNEHDQNLIRLGKYGIQQNDYGLIVRDEYNRDTVKINASGDVSITGHIEALSGKIGEHIYLDGERSRVTVKKGDEDVVTIGEIGHNVYGIDIKSGQSTLVTESSLSHGRTANSQKCKYLW